jgi:hypothetical protein
MRVLGRVRASFWIFVLGGIVLYAFFVSLANVSPGEIAGISIVAATLALVFTVRNVRYASQLAGNPTLRRRHNHLRERRGF